MPRGRPRNVKLNIDAAWLNQRVKQHGYKTFAGLARFIGIDKASMQRSITGERPFTSKDIMNMAAALDTTTDEIMRRVGFPIPERGIPIVGKITPDARVSFVLPKKGTEFFTRDVSPDAKCLIVDAETGSLAFAHDAKVVYLPSPPEKPVPVNVTGRLCVVECDNHLTPFLGILGKGATRNTSTLHLFGSGEKTAVNDVHSASFVLSIHFP